MFINYENLKNALLQSMQQYRKECYSSLGRFNPKHGKQGKLRSLKIEAYLTQIGNDEQALLLLTYAILQNRQGTTLQGYVREAIIESYVFGRELELAITKCWSDQLQGSQGMSGSRSMARMGGLKEVVVKAIQANDDPFSEDFKIKVNSICEVLNNSLTQILMSPFSSEMQARKLTK